MRIKGSSRGFSLVELLTVIAIIAILAAIIFPVMGVVKNRANQNKCMTQLQQIGAAMQMFKTDNRGYPEVLGAEAVDANGQPVTSNPVQFESTKGKYLFPEYVKSYLIFHCPQAQSTKTTDVAICQDPLGNTRNLYAYDNYDCFVKVPVASGQIGPANVEARYVSKWAADTAGVAGSGLRPYPPSTTDTPTLQQEDFERQLCFKNPPADTVVTWCSYHEGANGNGKSIVLFLDGHADSIPANESQACKWRLRPKKT